MHRTLKNAAFAFCGLAALAGAVVPLRADPPQDEEYIKLQWGISTEGEYCHWNFCGSQNICCKP
ncbi:MAG TPA: hypothetical protein VGC13_07625 [Longimicrobium sp.]|jgi:hypothetical protein|uniref:hypothetical protein n=1 Tax=Longimicrobium sp. TaxID=2029185 RepID=UPI002EDA6B76